MRIWGKKPKVKKKGIDSSLVAFTFFLEIVTGAFASAPIFRMIYIRKSSQISNSGRRNPCDFVRFPSSFDYRLMQVSHARTCNLLDAPLCMRDFYFIVE